MRVAFLIRAFGYGGAERQMACLAAGLARRGHDVSAHAYAPGDAYVPLMRDAGVEVTLPAEGTGRVAALRRLVKQVRARRADVLHAYMPPANVLAIALRKAFGARRVVCGLRASHMDWKSLPPAERMLWRAHIAMLPWADHVLANSTQGLVAFRAPRDRSSVVYNGIDTDEFRPDADARRRGRELLGAAPGEVWIGAVGRLDPEKHYENFIAMAGQVAASLSMARFAVIGGGGGPYAQALRAMSTAGGLDGRLRWVGDTRAVADIYNALDLVVSSSRSEGFSNALAEALACGAPVVATDVGEARVIVAPPDRIVPAGNPQALAEAVIAQVQAGRPQVEAMRRHERIRNEFAVEEMVRRTERILGDVLGQKS